MRFAYTTISFLVSLGFIGGAIYHFLESNDSQAKLFLLLALMAFLGVYYILKTLYYMKYHATFNEFSFVVFLPLAPVVQIMIKDLIEVSMTHLFSIQLAGNGSNFRLDVDILDVLMIPYFLFSIFLLLRSYLRYPFIRLRGHSKDGVSARFIAIILSAGIPILYGMLALIVLNNFMLLFIAIVYAIVGLVGLFV